MKIKEINLQQIIRNIYGSSLQKYRNIKTAHSIFTAYKNIQTEQIFYFLLLKAQQKSHLSQGTINYALKKYNPFLSKVQFLMIQKNFDTSYYLIKSFKCLMSLDQMVNIKIQCQQIMEKQHLIKTIEFLISIYKEKKCIQFPELTPKSIAITEQGQLKICDYTFYFKKQFQMRSLTQNMCSCILPLIRIALVKSSMTFLPTDDQFYRIKQYYGENFANMIKFLVLDPMENMQKQGVINGKGKQCNIQKIQQVLDYYYKHAQQDLNTTLNQTLQEDVKLGKQKISNKYKQSDLLTKDSLNQSFLSKDIDKKSNKMRNILLTAMFIMLLLLGTGVYFFFKYQSNQIVCDVGTYKVQDSNQCLSCSDGCLRCQSGQKTSCYSCSAKMFLVLNDEKDTTGACEATCVSGIILRSNLCLKKKPSNQSLPNQIIKNQKYIKKINITINQQLQQ